MEPTSQMLLWAACVHASCQGSMKYSRCRQDFSDESVLGISTPGMYKIEETLRGVQNAIMSLGLVIQGKIFLIGLNP